MLKFKSNCDAGTVIYVDKEEIACLWGWEDHTTIVLKSGVNQNVPDDIEVVREMMRNGSVLPDHKGTK